MLIRAILALTLLMLTFPADALSFSIRDLLREKDVIIFGETHRRPESTKFVTNTVAEYLHGGNCLTVGLEIPSHQQPILDRALKGNWIPARFSIWSIPLSSFIDHPGYRKMLSSFRNQIWKGNCLKVRAIDKPQTVPVSRDEWMEKQILAAMDSTPILVLVGNFHAMKEVRWQSDPLAGKSLGERLVDRGIKVASMLQYWEKQRCHLRSEKMVDTEKPESAEYIKQITDAIHAETPDKASEVADGVIVWQCLY